MLTKRIIPCLDILNGATVKGVQFVDLRDAGDPIALAMAYEKAGADELVFLDIGATPHQSKALLSLVASISKHLRIPFTVGGGIKTVADAAARIANGADKVSLNSAAVKRPELISEIADRFGRQAVVVAIDCKQIMPGQWEVFTAGGRIATGKAALAWATLAVEHGAGELLITSMDQDGTKTGFDLALLQLISSAVPVPVIASGGAGNASHFVDVFEQTQCSAALAAGIFHFGEISIASVKNELNKQNIPVRWS